MLSEGFAPAPERNPHFYGPRARQNRAKCSQLAADFFRDSVKRARERNLRWAPIIPSRPVESRC